MKPLPFVFPHALIFWAIFVWAFWPEFQIVRRARQSVRRADSPDAGSYRAIAIGMWIAFAAAFPLARVHGLRFPKTLDITVFIVGVVLLTGGSLLRRHCWRILGSSFTGDVQARAGQRIVTSGAYALLRHPSYTAGILMNAGVGLALGSWGDENRMPLRVVIADNDRKSRGMVRRTIEGRAQVVGEAKSDAEAIRMAHKLKPDVILMDADLPPAGGVDTTRTIKAQHPEVEVVVIHVDEAESFHKGKSGASLFRKKIVRAKIQSVVHAATRDGRTTR